MYYERLIDKYLSEWAAKDDHKPVLLRGARQVGKSTAVRHLGERFDNYIEVNFEKNPSFKPLFQGDLDVRRIVPQMEAIAGKPIRDGKTLLFFDEIQECPRAIMSLRFFREDMPALHVIAAGSLLEFAMEELPTFGVGRIHSMFMHPMTFDEFLKASGETMLMDVRNQASPSSPLHDSLHDRLVSLLRVYMLVGGMPEVVAKWVQSHDFLQCQEAQDDIIATYEEDFPKYRKKIDPALLRETLRNAAVNATKKLVYSKYGKEYKLEDKKKAVEMLVQAGLLIPVDHSDANGLPLGSEVDTSRRKLLLLDTGLMLRLLNMSMGDTTEITTHILTSNAADLVNKGPMAEQVAGLELLRHQSPNLRHSLYYWTRQAKNSQSEIDYLTSTGRGILPIEVKSGVQGGMKSLWMFMREKGLTQAVRCSLENFGSLDYIDSQDPNGEVRHLTICPLYAISMLLPSLLRQNQ
ncbi:MAG: AAA family ATPase [Bacteroidales bacterium]|nr:AAA family ATPase [Bacteroidales bacterium]